MNSIQENKIKGLVGEVSFSIILTKDYAVGLGIQHGDFVKVRQEEDRIIIEKAQNGREGIREND